MFDYRVVNVNPREGTRLCLQIWLFIDNLLELDIYITYTISLNMLILPACK